MDVTESDKRTSLLWYTIHCSCKKIGTTCSGRYFNQYNDIQHNDTQHYDIQHNDTQHNGIQQYNEQNATLSIMTFNIMKVCYAKCHK